LGDIELNDERTVEAYDVEAIVAKGLTLINTDPSDEIQEEQEQKETSSPPHHTTGVVYGPTYITNHDTSSSSSWRDK
jgi:hypothetical protein